MNEFLKADDVFEWLFRNNYAERFVWKNMNLQTSEYMRSFFCSNCALNSIHSFQIIVKENVHYISRLSVKIFCKLHGLDFQEISDEISN